LFTQGDEKAFDDLPNCFGHVDFRRRLWTFFERPQTTSQAKTFELVSTLFVLVSVLGLSFGTVPDFQALSILIHLYLPIFG
jgi:hypothetical protein